MLLLHNRELFLVLSSARKSCVWNAHSAVAEAKPPLAVWGPAVIPMF